MINVVSDFESVDLMQKQVFSYQVNLWQSGQYIVVIVEILKTYEILSVQYVCEICLIMFALALRICGAPLIQYGTVGPDP